MDRFEARSRRQKELRQQQELEYARTHEFSDAVLALLERLRDALLATYEKTSDTIVEVPGVAPIIEKAIISEELNCDIVGKLVETEEHNVVSKEEELVENTRDIVDEIVENAVENNVLEPDKEEIVERHCDVEIASAEIGEDSPIILVDEIDALEHMDEHMDDVKTTQSAGVHVQLKDLHAFTIYVDPFLVHCIPLYFVIADFYAVKITMYKRMITELFTSLFFLDVIHCVGILLFVWPRLQFDPGGFDDESLRRRGNDVTRKVLI